MAGEAHRAIGNPDALSVAQGKAQFLMHLPVQPSVLTFNSANSQTLSVTVKQKTTVFAASNDPSVASVEPNSIEVHTLKNGSGTATFTVTPHKNGKAGIGLVDLQTDFALVPVTVSVNMPDLLYVAERIVPGDVKVYDTADLSKPPATIGPLSAPEGVALAVDGMAGIVYATEDAANDVKVYHRKSNGQFEFVTVIGGFDLPSGIAVDPSSAKLFVTELGNVKVFGTANHQYQYLTTLGASVGVTDPGGLAVDRSAGKLYVAQGTGNVKVFDIAHLSAEPSTIDGLLSPGGVAVDDESRKIYITENYVGDVKVYSSTNDHRYLGTVATGLVEPFGDAVDEKTGKLYAVETSKGDVEIFSLADPGRAPVTIPGLRVPWAVAVSQ